MKTLIADRTMEIKTATIIGYHGYKNMGDDIFLQIIFSWLHNSLKITRFFVASKNKDEKRKYPNTEIRWFHNAIPSIHRTLWLSAFLNAVRSDYLIFAAGSIFTIQPFFIMYITLKLLKLVKGQHLKIYAIGVSIGPFKNNKDEFWCKKALELMDYVLLRDQQSSSRIAKMKTTIKASTSYDLALMHPPIARQNNRQRSQKILGVSITERGFGDCSTTHSKNCNTITNALLESVKTNPSIRLRIINVCADIEDGDRLIAEHLIERLQSIKSQIELIEYNGINIDSILNSIAGCDLLISSRMHTGIMGILANRPVFQISYAEKISNFYNQCGLFTDHLVSDDTLTQSKLMIFVRDALNNNLTDYSNTQLEILMQKGDQLRKDLNSMITTLNHPNAHKLHNQ